MLNLKSRSEPETHSQTDYEKLCEIFEAKDSFIAPELLRVTNGFTPSDPDWELATRQGAADILTEVAPDIFSFPFMTPDWCERCIKLAEMTQAYQREASDAELGAPEARLFRIAPVFAEVFNRYVVRRVMPLIHHVWTLYPNVVHPPFITRYTMDTQQGIGFHHDNVSDVTISLSLNDAFKGGGIYFERQNYTTSNLAPGTGILFPGKVTHRHRGEAITSGTRFVMTTWVQHKDQ